MKMIKRNPEAVGVERVYSQGRRRFLRATSWLTLAAIGAPALAATTTAVLYKNPDCGCCDDYADYLRAHGIAVTVVPTPDLARLRRHYEIPAALAGCHVTRIGRYVFDGHILIASVRRVLAERPRIIGLSVPGMPAGSPGMSGKKQGPLNVYEISRQSPPRLYAAY